MFRITKGEYFMKNVRYVGLLVVSLLIVLSIATPGFNVGAQPALQAVNVALNKPVTCSSIESGAFPCTAAVDGNLGTRWSSAFSDPQWIQVDLGQTYSI